MLNFFSDVLPVKGLRVILELLQNCIVGERLVRRISTSLVLAQLWAPVGGGAGGGAQAQGVLSVC